MKKSANNKLNTKNYHYKKRNKNNSSSIQPSIKSLNRLLTKWVSINLFSTGTKSSYRPKIKGYSFINNWKNKSNKRRINSLWKSSWRRKSQLMRVHDHRNSFINKCSSGSKGCWEMQRKRKDYFKRNKFNKVIASRQR